VTKFDCKKEPIFGQNWDKCTEVQLSPLRTYDQFLEEECNIFREVKKYHEI